MTTTSSQSVLLATSESSLASQPKRAKPPVSSGVVGMLLFMVTEVMFFGALISAYLVIRAGLDEWPPWGQPRLPIETTAINTLVLLVSGLLMSYSDDDAVHAVKRVATASKHLVPVYFDYR